VPARRDDDTRFVKQSYYLEPEPVGRKAFELLRTVLAEREIQAVCKIVLKDREHLASLDPYGPTMLLSTLYWPDEIRDVGDLDLPETAPEFKPAEIEMAGQLVDALTGEFEPERYKDEYREALLQVIAQKVDGQPVEAPAAEPETSKLTDLMAVLEASVAAARGERVSDDAASSAPQPPVSVKAARASRTSASGAKSAARAKSTSGAKAASGAKAKRTATGSKASQSTEGSKSTAPARRRKSA
jgi:DNA end-binding protein Ku